MVERIEQQVGVLRLECERRADFQDVGAAAGGADENAAAAHAVHDAPRLGAAANAAGAVRAELDPDEQSGAADLADRSVPLRELLQPAPQILTAPPCILQQILTADHLQHGERRGAGHAVATVGVEIASASGELGKHAGATYDGRDRVTVAHGFAHGDQVRNDAVTLEAPHGLPEAAEAGLHLIGDEQPAGLVHPAHRIGEEASRLRHHAIAREDGIHQHRRGPYTIGPHPLEAPADLRGEIGGTSSAEWWRHRVDAGPEWAAVFGRHAGDDI